MVRHFLYLISLLPFGYAWAHAYSHANQPQDVKRRPVRKPVTNPRPTLPSFLIEKTNGSQRALEPYTSLQEIRLSSPGSLSAATATLNALLEDHGLHVPPGSAGGVLGVFTHPSELKRAPVDSALMSFPGSLTLQDLAQLMVQTATSGAPETKPHWAFSFESTPSTHQTVQVRSLLHAAGRYTLVTTTPTQGPTGKDTCVAFFPGPLPLSRKDAQDASLGILHTDPPGRGAQWLFDIFRQGFSDKMVEVAPTKVALIHHKYIMGEDNPQGNVFPHHMPLDTFLGILESTWGSPPITQGKVAHNRLCPPYPKGPGAPVRECRIYFHPQTLTEYLLTTLEFSSPSSKTVHLEAFAPLVSSPIDPTGLGPLSFGDIWQMFPKEHDRQRALLYALKAAGAQGVTLSLGAIKETYTAIVDPKSSELSPLLAETSLDTWARAVVGALTSVRPSEVPLASLEHRLPPLKDPTQPLFFRRLSLGSGDYHLFTQKQGAFEAFLGVAPVPRGASEFNRLAGRTLEDLMGEPRERVMPIFNSVWNY